MLVTGENSIRFPNSLDEINSKSENLASLNSQRTQIYVEKMINTEIQPDKKNILYETVGTKVSKLREINEVYLDKIKQQDDELKLLNEKINNKMKLLSEMRDQKKLQDENWVNEKYYEMVEKNQIKIKINVNHVNNDPSLKIIYNEKQAEVGALQTKLNTLIKKTESVKNDIQVLRIENYKYQSNLDAILNKKDAQSREMDFISKQANKYLEQKANVNNELAYFNDKIEVHISSYDTKMVELNKMIENTKKIKEFHETLAKEKFTKKNFRRTEHDSPRNKPINKISEDENKLAGLNSEYKKNKQQTVYLNFCRFILLKKHHKLNFIIEKVKNETGVESLDKLSKYLEVSSNTNKLFETDLKILNEQRIKIEKEIENIKLEINDANCLLNDTSTNKLEYSEKLKKDLNQEQDIKNKLNKKLFTMNRLLELISHGFVEICKKLNLFDTNLKSDNNEQTLTKLIDLIERKLYEIVQYNADSLKTEDNKNEELKFFSNLEKVSENIYSEDPTNLIDLKKNNLGNFTLENIKENANDFVNYYLKKYEKN